MNWIHAIIAIVVVLGGVLTTCMYLIWIERNLSARIQDRIGPNRVGPFGLLQSVADGIKFVLKEDVIPATADKTLFIVAPTISVFTTMLAFSVVPFGPPASSPGGFPYAIAHQPRHRHSVRVRGHQPGRVRRDSGGLGLEQQIQRAGQPPLERRSSATRFRWDSRCSAWGCWRVRSISRR